MIKYLGSKYRLIHFLSELFRLSGAETALDLFTGTTRMAQEFKRRGAFVTAVDIARYSEVFAKCHIETDAARVDQGELREALRYLESLPGRHGYFTETFCIRSRYFQPFNGMRVDAIRDAIEAEFKGSPLYPLLLTSLIYAADRVDSTTGIQTGYLQEWSSRSYNPLKLQMPELYVGPGRAVRGDACEVVHTLEEVDLAYLDPPYNQIRYDTNYHVWETLVAWDAPEHYGVACKRIDRKDPTTKSVFNVKREMPNALRQLIADVRAKVVVLSYNNESWLTLNELIEACSVRGHVAVLAFDSKRYMSHLRNFTAHLRNVEYVFVAGPEDVVVSMTAPLQEWRTPHQQARLF